MSYYGLLLWKEPLGVIFGRDLVYRFEEGGWAGQTSQSKDPVVKRSGRKRA